MKKSIIVLFGGRSSEHDVSCISAQTIVKNINQLTYDITLIGITVEGHWLLVDSVDAITDGTWRKSKKSAILSPDTTTKELIIKEGNQYSSRKVDVVFPVLHGLYGEDGTIQGLFEMAGLPYVGCGVLASAVSMDKFFTKIIVDSLNIRQAAWVPVRKKELTDVTKVIERIESKLSYPVFVKPSNAGSSKGVSKAENASQLRDSLMEAANHDSKILVEETIVGREIECAILGSDNPKASGVGEILTAADTDFYDFEAKYHDENSKTELHPEFPAGKEAEVRAAALKIFQAVDGSGLARVDFFLEAGTNEVVFNEINTMPGFTSISMYPMLWEDKGMSNEQLIDKLIQLAYI